MFNRNAWGPLADEIPARFFWCYLNINESCFLKHEFQFIDYRGACYAPGMQLHVASYLFRQLFHGDSVGNGQAVAKLQDTEGLFEDARC